MRAVLVAAFVSITALAAPSTDVAPAVAQARSVLDEGENTEANLRSVIASMDTTLTDKELSGRQRCLAQTNRALAFMRLGDLEKSEDPRLKLFEQGQDAARAAIAADPGCPAGHYYLGATLGKWGQAKGVFKAIFLLDDIKREFRKTIELDPSHVDARLALGAVEKEVPGILGGSKERAEVLIREALARDPAHTRGMLDLAVLLKDDGRKDEAKKLVQAVLNHPAPSRPWEWRKFDRARAEKLAKEWGV
jgi:tetratricopeptide (TPR) repeat protein